MRDTLACLAVIALSLSIYGCGSPVDTESMASPSSSSADGIGTHNENVVPGSEDGLSNMEKMKVELAKLSSEDAASALKQHVCPVSGEMLGAMGAPIKVDVSGQQVWLCCEGCRKSLLKNPSEYLAKLKN